MLVLTRRTLQDEAATVRYRIYYKKKKKIDDRIFWLLNVKLAGAKVNGAKNLSFLLCCFFLFLFFCGVQSFAFFERFFFSDYGDL